MIDSRGEARIMESLPGGDPLAAALAAGETPSPRVVAAAGAEGSLSPRVAWTLLASCVVMLALVLAAQRKTALSRFMSLERSPEVLRVRANDILRTLGVPARGAAVASFRAYNDYVRWLHARGGARKWDPLRNGPAPYAYRLQYGTPPLLARLRPRPANAPAWTAIEVDPHGRLSYLLAAPEHPWKPKPLDWKPLLDAAGLAGVALRPIPPRDAPAAPFDARAAWSGTYPNDSTPIRVEAAAWQGTPVYFRVTGAWDPVAPLPGHMFANPAVLAFQNAVWFLVYIAALFFAWRNLRLRRGDRQGATRVAFATFVLAAASGLLTASYGADRAGVTEDLRARLGEAALGALIVLVMYIALEPYVRRRWPEQLISWARLVAGRANDPLVGHHVLVGLLLGVAHTLLALTGPLVVNAIKGEPPINVSSPPPDALHAIAHVLDFGIDVVKIGALMMMALVILTMVLRKRVLAVGVFALLNLAFFVLAVRSEPRYIPFFVIVVVLITFATLRYGLLAAGMVQSVTLLLFAVKPAGPAWILTSSAIVLLAFLALAIWAFRTSLGGQSPFSVSLLDE